MSLGRNFLPGPTGVHPDVLAAMNAPMFAQYGPRMPPILEEIQPALQTMLGTRQPVVTVTSSGTGMLEGMIRGAVHHRVLVAVGGFFGEYLARVAEHCGKEVVRVNVPAGRPVEAEQIEALLDGPPVDAVAVVHSESSTGALAPLEDIARVVRNRPDLLFLVDAISSAAGVPIEMDRIGIDFVTTGSQKALALPPGLAFGAASERYLARAATIPDAGYYFNIPRLVGMARRYQAFETPALSLYLALVVQLRRIEAAGGFPARWRRQAALAERFWLWADAHPAANILSPAGRRSPTVSGLILSQGRDPVAIGQQLDAAGFLVGQAIGGATGPMLRVGHMGDVEEVHLNELIAALEPLLAA
ncbi:MAG: alanine--glyoxylate aminotransferase family protein [Gemmatimonadales bacterium]